MNGQGQRAKAPGTGADADPVITIQELAIAFGSYIVLQGLTFTIRRGDVFVVMGGSGCGKSTLLRCMIGLKEPRQGTVRYGADSYWDANPLGQERIRRRFGVLYQQGALWSSMTLAENIALPLGEYTYLSPRQIGEVASLKLALVGLAGFEEYYPSEISGGMRKRAALARAMALDPEILFFDEPSAGLDPITSKLLDDLILELKESLGATIVLVTHELTSIFAIGSQAIFLDPETKTMIASGPPKTLLAECKDPKVHAFLTRGEGMGQAAVR